MKVRTLRAEDIGGRDQREDELPVYQMLVSNFLAERPPLYLDLNGRAAIRQMEQFGWRPESPRFILSKGTKIPCPAVFHAAIHFFLVKKFGSRLKGRPFFVLLCEAITSQSQFYFDLEVLRQFGPTAPVLNRLKVETLTYSADIFGQSKADKYVLKLMQSKSEQESFQKYRGAVLEMFATYKYMLALLKKGEARGPIDIVRVNEKFKKGKYGPLTCGYSLGVNVMYALINCQETTADDSKTLKNCLNELNKANSFQEFLLSLGLVEASPLSKVA